MTSVVIHNQNHFVAPGVATLFDPAFRFRPERQRRGRNRNGGPNKVAQPVGLRSSGPQATKWLESNMQCQARQRARIRAGSDRAGPGQGGPHLT